MLSDCGYRLTFQEASRCHYAAFHKDKRGEIHLDEKKTATTVLFLIARPERENLSGCTRIGSLQRSIRR